MAGIFGAGNFVSAGLVKAGVSGHLSVSLAATPRISMRAVPEGG